MDTHILYFLMHPILSIEITCFFKAFKRAWIIIVKFVICTKLLFCFCYLFIRKIISFFNILSFKLTKNNFLKINCLVIHITWFILLYKVLYINNVLLFNFFFYLIIFSGCDLTICFIKLLNVNIFIFLLIKFFKFFSKCF